MELAKNLPLPQIDLAMVDAHLDILLGEGQCMRLTLPFVPLALSILLTGCGDSSSSVREVSIAGNVDARALVVGAESIPMTTTTMTRESAPTSFTDLAAKADFSTSFGLVDEHDAEHRVILFFFHTAPRSYLVRAYVAAAELQDPLAQSADSPTQLVRENGDGDIALTFDEQGQLIDQSDLRALVQWLNADPSELLLLFDFSFLPEPGQITSFSVT